MKTAAIIVGGGSGTRMGHPLPKQFIEVGGWPLIMHPAHVFREAFPDITLIMVIPGKYFLLWDEMVHRYRFRHSCILVEGGETRFHSVKNGLQKLTGEELVAVHDAVRPVISKELVRRCFALAEEKGSAIPVISPVESLRKVKQEGSQPVNREEFRIVQTPQVFHTGFLQEAYDTAFDPAFTDDASVMEASGYEVFLTEGERSNIKITHPDDLKLAAQLLKKQK